MPEHNKKQVLRRFVTGRFGQVHLREIAAQSVEREPPLVCLHPAPYSGLYFTSVMPLLNEHRRVIAPDYPGYGASAPTPFQPTIDDYALAMLDVSAALEFDEFDLVGFHTGCLVAVEMALRRANTAPDIFAGGDVGAKVGSASRIRSLILIDVPYFTAAERIEKLSEAAQPLGLTPDIDSVAARWQFGVTNRVTDMSLQRAVDLFCDSLTDSARSHWAFAAAREYPCEERFKLIETPCTFIATDSALQNPTRVAAKTVRHGQLVECPQVKTAVFESGAATIAKTIKENRVL